MNTYYKTLTIAGSDSGGGAGIQADLKTFSALGCYGMSAITALTAQNTLGVQAIHAVPASFVTQQIDSIFQDMGADAVKIGMLHSAEIITAVAECLVKYQPKFIILDPVMVAKDGSALLQPSAQQALQQLLLPLATIVTPNLLETEQLLQQSIRDETSMQQAAKLLCDQGPTAVLIKGGHLESNSSNDCLYLKETQQWHWFNHPRIDTKNTHGTGCTLSAAITAYLARGKDLLTAVTLAKKYLTSAIESGKNLHLGQGQGPVHHFHHLWELE